MSPFLLFDLRYSMVQMNFLKVIFLTNGTIYLIYLKIFTNYDILEGCGESGIKSDNTEMRAFFQANSQTDLTHT